MSSNDQENYNSNEVGNIPVVMNEESQSPLNIASNDDEENSNSNSEQEQIHGEHVPTIIDPVRQYMLQKHLVLLIHAQTCLEDESERNIPASSCRVAFCDVMRNVLKHMETCLDGINCTYELCSASQLLLYHLQNCGQATCPLCAPFIDTDVLLTSPEPESSSDTENNINNYPRRIRSMSNLDLNPQEGVSSLEEILHSPNGISRWVENTRKLVQLNWQLFLLLHADKCRAHRSLLSCPTPNCQEFRTALNHMPNCQAGRNCTFPHCSASRQIINHWLNCRSSICPLCVPIRQLEGVRSRNFFTSVLQSSRIHRNPGPSSAPPPLRPIGNQPSSSQNLRNNGQSLNSIAENDQINGINSDVNNPPGVRGQGSGDINSYRTPLDVNVNQSTNRTNYNRDPLPLLIHVSHGPSCSLSTNAAGSLQLCSSAEHHYQQSGFIFSNPNPPTTQTDVSPPGVRVGSLPGYGPDDVSPPGVRIGSLPGYGPDDISPPGMRIGSYNLNPTVETNETIENNQTLLRVCDESVNNSSSSSKIDLNPVPEGKISENRTSGMKKYNPVNIITLTYKNYDRRK